MVVTGCELPVYQVFFTFTILSSKRSKMVLFVLDFDSTLEDEVDIPLPTAESKEELDEVDEEIDEGEEELGENEDEEEQSDDKEDQKGDERAESGAETSESEQVVVTPSPSRSKSALKVNEYGTGCEQ